jgi:hypothetical protein
VPTPGKTDEQKRRHRAADLSIKPPPPDWIAARRQSVPEWDHRELFPVWIGHDSTYEAQVYQRTRRDPKNRQLVDFAIGLQLREVETDDPWVDIARVDCADEGVHVDRCNAEGEESKDFDIVPADAREDLDQAYLWALDYVWDTEARLKGWL